MTQPHLLEYTRYFLYRRNRREAAKLTNPGNVCMY